MCFRIGDIVRISSINSSKWVGQVGPVTEVPCSHSRYDYGVDIFSDGRPTIGFDVDQLILLFSGEIYLRCLGFTYCDCGELVLLTDNYCIDCGSTL